VEISISIKSTFMCLTCFMPQRQQQRHHHHHSANEIVSILFMHLTSPEKENCRNWLIKYLFIRKCLACFSLRTFLGLSYIFMNCGLSEMFLFFVFLWGFPSGCVINSVNMESLLGIAQLLTGKDSWITQPKNNLQGQELYN